MEVQVKSIQNQKQIQNLFKIRQLVSPEILINNLFILTFENLNLRYLK